MGTEKLEEVDVAAETKPAEVKPAVAKPKSGAVNQKSAVAKRKSAAATPEPALPPASWRDRSIALTRERLIAAAAVAAVLLGGTGSVCGYYAIQKSSAADRVAAADSRQADKDAASKAASGFLTTMFSVDDGSLERWDNAVLATTTDSMHQQLGQWRNVLERLIKAHVEMSSKVTDIGVVSQNGEAVTLLAVIESTGRTDPDAAQSGVSSSAALIEMRRVDDRWKVEGYGPAGGIPAVAPTETTPQTPPAETPAPEQTPR